MSAGPVLDILRQACPDAAIDDAASPDMPTIFVDREHLLEVVETLRDHPSLQFAFLVDVTAVDYLPAEPRYEAVYHFACLGEAYGTAPARRLRVRVRIPGADPRVPSLVSLFPAAGWPEREVFDLFGLSFDRHPDLRRILTADGWEGYPLRKDYPVQIRKETAAWSPVQLSVEEFAANIRADRERATEQARPSRAGELRPKT